MRTQTTSSMFYHHLFVIAHIVEKIYIENVLGTAYDQKALRHGVERRSDKPDIGE